MLVKYDNKKGTGRELRGTEQELTATRYARAAAENKEKTREANKRTQSEMNEAQENKVRRVSSPASKRSSSFVIMPACHLLEHQSL